MSETLDSKDWQLTTMWNAGVPVSAIGVALGGWTKGAVIGRAHTLNLGPHPHAQPTTQWTAARLNTLIAYNAAGMMQVEIAAELGVSAETIGRVLRELKEGKTPKLVFDWTDERIEDLIRHWRGGLTARAIAHELGANENTINTKIAELRKSGVSLPPRSTKPPKPLKSAGLNFMAEPSVDKLGTKPPRQVEESRGEAEIAAHLPPTDEPLSDQGCRWPVGDARAINNPAHGSFRFCRAGKKNGGSYCAAHEALAYRTLKRTGR